MLNDGHHHMSTLLIIYNQNFSGVLCLNKYIPQSYTRNKQKYENMENRGKVKNELRVQTYELRVQIHKSSNPRITSSNSQVTASNSQVRTLKARVARLKYELGD